MHTRIFDQFQFLYKITGTLSEYPEFKKINNLHEQMNNKLLNNNKYLIFL